LAEGWASVQLKACEIRLRAERRAGELLKDLQKAVGARKDIRPRANADQRLTKKEQIERAGLTEKQAKNFQRLASVPKEIFDAELTALERDEHVAEWTRLAEEEARNSGELKLSKFRQFLKDGAGTKKASAQHPASFTLTRTRPTAPQRLPASRQKPRKPRANGPPMRKERRKLVDAFPVFGAPVASCGFRSRTPVPPPLSAMNSTPAASRAAVYTGRNLDLLPLSPKEANAGRTLTQRKNYSSEVGTNAYPLM
jgi:hypothetical protein